jgi:hypothetical protein
MYPLQLALLRVRVQLGLVQGRYDGRRCLQRHEIGGLEVGDADGLHFPVGEQLPW